MENNNVIYGINGPVVTVKNTDSFEMMEMVHVGKQKLVGEIIGITDDITTIQVYEETTGLKPGDPVEGTGACAAYQRHDRICRKREPLPKPDAVTLFR